MRGWKRTLARFTGRVALFLAGWVVVTVLILLVRIAVGSYE